MSRNDNRRRWSRLRLREPLTDGIVLLRLPRDADVNVVVEHGRDPDVEATRWLPVPSPGPRDTARRVVAESSTRAGEGGSALRSSSPTRRAKRSSASSRWCATATTPARSPSPKARAVTGVVTGGAILLAAALLALFTDLWWLVLLFCWMVFPALGTFSRGIAGLMDSREEERLPENGKERELLEALRDRGELTPVQAAVESLLTVNEADEILKELAEGGHLEVRVRGGGLSYSLWDYEKVEERRGIGRLRADRTL